MLYKKKNYLEIILLISIIFSNVVGSGIFFIPSLIGRIGTIGILGYIITSCGAIFLSYSFARLNILFPEANGISEYCALCFNDMVGFIVKYNYWLSLWIGNIGISLIFSEYFSFIFPFFKRNIYTSLIIPLLIIWIFAVINIIYNDSIKFFQFFSIFITLFPILLVIVFGPFYIKIDNLLNFNISHDSNFSALIKSITLTLWSFIGIESATLAKKYVENSYNIFLATILGTLLISLLYISSLVIILGIIPVNILINYNISYIYAIKKIFNIPFINYLIFFSIMFSCLGTLNGSIFLQKQLCLVKNYNIKKNINIIFSSILSTILLAICYRFYTKHFSTFIIGLSLFFILISYLYTIFAELFIRLLSYTKNFNIIYKLLFLSIINSIYIFFSIWGIQKSIIFVGILLNFISIFIYYFL